MIASTRYALIRLADGRIRVFDRATRESAYYRRDGTYDYGTPAAPTLRALLRCATEQSAHSYGQTDVSAPQSQGATQ